MEQTQGKLVRPDGSATVSATAPEAPPLTKAVAPVREVKQLVRTIGTVDSPETQAVERVNATLAGHLNDGWTIHTARPVAAGVGGSVVVYFLLIK